MHPTASTRITGSCGRTCSRTSTSIRRTCTSPTGRWRARRGRGLCGVRSGDRAVGGIDFQLLGIGKTGHIGFNEPGSGEQSRTRLVHLDIDHASRRRRRFLRRRERAARSDHDGHRDDPRRREIAILATGEHKAGIVRRAVEGEIDRAVAATFLQRHPNTTFYVDDRGRRRSHAGGHAVAARRSGVGNARGARRDVAVARSAARRFSSSRTDYAENHLSVAGGAHGSPGGERPRVQHAGREDSRQEQAAARARTICFSPHPDDDVISMGGILRKFVENGNDMTVAYMTSGNIAVFDHDVRRYIDFLVRLDASDRRRCRVQQLATPCTVSCSASSPATWTSPRCRTSSASSANRKR
jgi:glucosamine-6-phosphate deaminase